MPTPHERAAEINAFLSSTEGKTIAELRPMAENYAELSRQAYVRLRRCEDYLRRSLWSEAVYEAEIQPDLIRLVSDLSLDAFDRWDALCKQHGLPRPVACPVDIAVQLNQAYVVLEQIQPLLEELRRLNLARAPVKTRLRVLRAIAGKDPTNAAFDADIREFEQVRIREIEKETKLADADDNLEHLRELAAELDGVGWRIHVSGRVIADLRDAIERIETDRVLQQLSTLLDRMHEAYGDLAYDECREMLDEWCEIVSRKEVALPEDMDVTFRTINEWCRGEAARREKRRRFEDACLALANAVNESAPANEIRRLLREAGAFGFTISPDLVRDADDELDRQRLARRRRARAILAIAAVLTLAAAAGVWLLVREGLARRDASREAARIDVLLENDKLDEAGRAWDALERKRPDLVSRGVLLSAHGRLLQAVEAEEQRALDFRRNMDAVLSAGPDTPDAERLAAAESLAKLDEEKLEILKFKRRISEAAQARQTERDNAFSARLATLSADFDKIDPNRVHQDPAAFDQSLDVLDTRLKGLESTPDVSEELRGQAAVLRGRLGQWRALSSQVAEVEREKRLREQQLLAEARAVDALVLKVSAAPDPAKAIRDFLQENPQSSKAEVLRSVLKQAPDWPAVMEYETLVRPWNDVAPADADDCAKRTKAVADYLQKRPASPFSSTLKEYALYLERAAKAADADSPWTSTLPELLRGELICVNSLVSNGKTYYLRKDTKATPAANGDLVVLVLVDTDMNAKTKRFPRGSYTEPGPSPQAKLADELILKLNRFSMSNWEDFGLQLCEMVQKNKEVDPILKSAILSLILKMTRDCGWGAADEIDRCVKALSTTQDVGSWMDPDSAEARAARVAIEKTFADLPDMSELRKLVQRKKAHLEADLSFRCRARGLLLKEAEGWKLFVPDHAKKDGWTAVALVKEAGAETAGLRPVATCRRGEFVISEPDAAAVSDGALVFIVEGKTEATDSGEDE